MASEEDLQKLVAAVEAALSPASSQEARAAAHKLLESFKEEQADPSVVGFVLLQNSNPLVRYSGLHFVEHAIKYRWSELSCERRQMIQTGCFEALRGMGEGNLLGETLARCVAEMAASEWPQLWPDFTQLCRQCCQLGDSQAVVILLALLRLVQDVATQPTIVNVSRRRDLNRAIVLVLPELFDLTGHCLQGPPMSAAAGRRIRAALELVAEMAEFAPSEKLEPFLRSYLGTTCGYLQNDDLRLHSIAVLRQLASRRCPKAEHITVMQLLFHQDTLDAFFSAAGKIVESSADLDASEMILISEFLILLATLLCSAMMLKDSDSRLPASYGSFLNAVLTFLKCPYLRFRHAALHVFHQLLNEPKTANSQQYLTVFPEVLANLPMVVRKEPMTHDFDTEDDYTAELSHCRERAMKLLRDSIPSHGEISFDICSNWLQNRLHLADPNEYDSMTRIIRCVMDGIAKKHIQTLTGRMGGLLDGVLTVMAQTADWAALDRQLSVMSSLLVCLPACPDRLATVLQQIARPLLTTDEGSGQVECRRHALADLQNIATEYSEQLSYPYVPSQENLCVEAHEADVLGLAEQCVGRLSLQQQGKLFVTLVQLANGFADAARRRQLVNFAAADAVRFLASDLVTQAVRQPSDFSKFIGLQDASPLASESCPFTARRKELRGRLSVLLAVIQNLKVSPENSAEVYEIWQPAVANLFYLARSLNGLSSSEAVALIHPSFGINAISLSSGEYSQVFATTEALITGRKFGDTDTPVAWMRAFLAELTDELWALIGHLVTKFGQDFFCNTAASQYLLHGCLGLVDECLDFRLQRALRRVWKPLAASVAAAPDHLAAVAPAFAALSQHLNQRLAARWQQISASNELEREGADQSTQEIFLECSTINLSREYVQLLCQAYVVHSNLSGDKKKAKRSETSLELSPLLMELLRDEATMAAIVLCSFSALSWDDSLCATRIVSLCGILLDWLVANNRMDAQTACHLLYGSLKSLQVHGHDEVLLSQFLRFALRVYEKLRPSFQELRDILLSVPECSEGRLLEFDQKITDQTKSSQLSEKWKRDEFKELVSGIIGENLGRKFRKPVQLRDLPPLLIPSKRKNSDPIVAGITDLFG